MKFHFTNPRRLPLALTQGFGENIEYYKKIGLKNGHNGWDLIANDGDDILASHDGVVTFAGEDGSGGLGVVIRTAKEFEDINGRPSYWKSVYWHLQTGSICVHASQEVKKGQKIGQADNTGFSTGTHLHFGIKPVKQGEQEWQWDNVDQDNGFNGAVDPAPYYVHRFDKDMAFGDRSDEVKKLQNRMTQEGFFIGEATGFYGTKTREAVYGYQISKGISPMMIHWYKGKYCGPSTRKILNEM